MILKKRFFILSLFLLSALSIFSDPAYSLWGSDSSNDNSGNTIYITIDDGPLAGMSNLLEVISQEKIPVTMFLVGAHVEYSQFHKDELVKAKSNPYILVANHSYSHANGHYQDYYHMPKKVLADMEKNNTILGLSKQPYYSRLPGRSVFRLPGLNLDDPYISRAEDKQENMDDNLLKSAGFYIYGWDLEWAHYASGRPMQSVEKLVEEIKVKFKNNSNKVKGHHILLMHDQMFSSHLDGKENFRKLIVALRKEGYKFAKIDQYPANFKR